MEIVLGRAMADEEEGDANEMDEHSDHNLANVQSKNSVSNSLFSQRDRGDERSDGSKLYMSETYLVVIHRHSGERDRLGRLAPRGPDERTSDDQVDDPVCPPPSTIGGQTEDEIVVSFVRKEVGGLTDW
jgi:hypothetical protein